MTALSASHCLSAGFWRLTGWRAAPIRSQTAPMTHV